MTRLLPHSKKIAVLGKKFKSCYLVDVLSVFNFAVPDSTHPVYMCQLSFFKEVWLLKNKFKSHYQPLRGIISIILETRKSLQLRHQRFLLFLFSLPFLFFYIYIYIYAQVCSHGREKERYKTKAILNHTIFFNWIRILKNPTLDYIIFIYSLCLQI